MLTKKPLLGSQSPEGVIRNSDVVLICVVLAALLRLNPPKGSFFYNLILADFSGDVKKKVFLAPALPISA